MINLVNEIELAQTSLREIKPLVLCLTNFVTMDLMANALLALGAAPLMSHSMDELEELISISHVLYVNIGTLDQGFCERAQYAIHLATMQNKPIILDPVGAGASRLRTEAAKAFLPLAHIIRGNPSEILALVDKEAETRGGVETSHTVSEVAMIAKKLAFSTQKTIVVSGPIDLVINAKEEANLPFGSELMPLITGMGCALTAVIAAFAALDLNDYQASLLATAYFGLCGQQSEQKSKEPGSFRQLFINALFKPDWVLFREFIARTHS